VQNLNSNSEESWDLRMMSQHLYFVEEESPENETEIHGFFYEESQAERCLSELEALTFQKLMEDKNFTSVEEAQAYLMDRDEDYGLHYSRFRILDFAEAVEAFGFETILTYITSIPTDER
jgi:hypothetical protein